MFIDNTKVSGQLAVKVYDKDGNLKDEFVEKNLLVTAGLAYIASRMKDATATAMTHMALGSGSTAASAGQTALVTQLGSRAALTATTVTSNQVEYTATFAAGVATGAVVEAGIFNASTAGTMLCRTVFGLKTKDAGDSFAMTWTITLAAA